MIKRVLPLSVLIFAGSSLWADEGRFPIYQPTTITSPGSYVLTRDIQVYGSTGITIAASDVTLDFAGHTITYPSGSLYNLIEVSEAATRILIKGGRLVGGGIWYTGTSRTTIRVEVMEIVRPITGIAVGSADFVEITGCIIREASQTGIDIRSQTASQPFRATLIDNTVSANQIGMQLIGISGSQVKNNRITGGDSIGLVMSSVGSPSVPCTGNVVEGNVLEGSVPGSHDGIEVYCNNGVLQNNHISNYGYVGLIVSGTRNRVVRNAAIANGGFVGSSYGSGILVYGSSNALEDNVSVGNARYGVEFSSGTANIYRDNILKGNALGSLAGVAGNTDGGGNVL